MTKRIAALLLLLSLAGCQYDTHPRGDYVPVPAPPPPPVVSTQPMPPFQLVPTQPPIETDPEETLVLGPIRTI